MKETARRFSQNETVEVTANDFDRSLAVDHDFIHIEGDKAIYANHWMAVVTRSFGTWYTTMCS